MQKNKTLKKWFGLKVRGHVRFQPDDVIVDYSVENSVLEVALAHGLPLTNSCGGMGTCGTCRVFVEGGIDEVPELNELEQEMSADRSFAPNERLACQMVPSDGLCVRIPTYRQGENVDLRDLKKK